MFVCWSVKGGSGTTVVAASLALLLARAHPVVLADLAGDLAAALGLPEPAGPGISEWMASPAADTPALARLAVPATDAIQLIPRGAASIPDGGPRWDALATSLLALHGTVVVDAGLGEPPASLRAVAVQSLLVIRPCYLAVRRAVADGVQPTGIVLVQEPGRALASADVERAIGAPVVAEVPFDPAVARAVDAGLLASRLPRTLAHPLRGAA
jgi:MinD-like ATPase involved in chromosome partitioning or flagellar assembly